ncbi:HAD family hydrolase [Thermococcus sp.]
MKLVSFDVWNTLLDINLMLDEIAIAIAKISGQCIADVTLAIMNARAEIKELRKEKKGNPERALEESQELLAEILGVDVEIIKRAASQAVLNVNRDIVMEGALETLQQVKSKGYTTITVGNVMFWPSTYTRLILERFGLAEFIDKQFYSDEVKAYKPMREFFEKALSYFKVKPEEAIHVGDTKAEDFEGALKAGMWAVWINPDAEGVKRIHERGFEVPSVEGLLEVLERIKSQE